MTNTPVTFPRPPLEDILEYSNGSYERTGLTVSKWCSHAIEYALEMESALRRIRADMEPWDHCYKIADQAIRKVIER